MAMDGSHQITRLLVDWGNGDLHARDELIPLVYDELRQMARSYMRRQSPGHQMQTTELIHEAYLKLASRNGRNWKNRAHFFGLAALAMRHILVDYARSKYSEKHGGPLQNISFDENIAVTTERSREIVALDDALKRLEAFEERKARVVEMKFFGGLSVEEIAEVMRVSPETVKRDWKFSRTWLLLQLRSE